jgi:cell division protein FtsB
MNSVQESKNELEAAIRYAENAISSAKQTIESMEFRQELAKKQYAEQTGREQALEAENAKLREDNERLTSLEIQLRDKIRELKAQAKQ